MTEGTKPLDAMQMLLAQLARIERSIESLPSLLARIEALTESTRQLEVALREQNREVAERGRAVDSLNLRVSEILAAVSGVSSDFREFKQDIQKRVATVERQSQAALDGVSVQNTGLRQMAIRIEAVESRQGDPEFRTRLEACANEFMQWRPVLAQVASVIETVQEWLPWWRAIKWAAGIAGAMLVTLIVAGIFWAIIQSGGRLP